MQKNPIKGLSLSLLTIKKPDEPLRAQWPFATYLYIAGLWVYLQQTYKVKIYKTTYW